MSSLFNNFIQRELPKRPFTEDDGETGQFLVRSSNADKPREMIWTSIENLISTYSKEEIDSSFAKIDHSHDWADIENTPNVFSKDEVIDSFAKIDHSHSWADINGKPILFPPELHSHSWADINGKPPIYNKSEIDNFLLDKSNLDHIHIISDITNLQATLDNKSPIDHTHDFNIGVNLINLIWVDGSQTTDYVQTGKIGQPFKTIQGALNYFNDPISSNDFSRPCVIYISPGVYTENLIVPCRPIMLYGQGVIINGHIIQPIANALKFGVSSSVYRPTLTISGHTVMDAKNTHRSRVHGIEVNGDVSIILDDRYTGYQGTHHDLVLSSVKITGNIINQTNTGGCICYFNNFRIDGNITGSEIQLYGLDNGTINGTININTLLDLKNINFLGNLNIITIETGNRWINCDFGNIECNITNTSRIFNLDSLSADNIKKVTFTTNPPIVNLLNKASTIKNDSIVNGDTVKEALETLNGSLNNNLIYVQEEEPTVYTSNTIWIKTF